MCQHVMMQTHSLLIKCYTDVQKSDTENLQTVRNLKGS